MPLDHRPLTAQLGDLAEYDFEVHAGANYVDCGLAAGLRAAGAHVERPAEGLGLFQQQAFYATGRSLRGLRSVSDESPGKPRWILRRLRSFLGTSIAPGVPGHPFACHRSQGKAKETHRVTRLGLGPEWGTQSPCFLARSSRYRHHGI